MITLQDVLDAQDDNPCGCGAAGCYKCKREGRIG